VTQWLVEEAAFLALDEADARAADQAVQDQARHARLTAMANRATGR
jgi:hypothetical protein